MSIKWRLFCGFALMLVLTVGVAVTGWVSLTGFARRVDASNGAQSLANRIGDLALSAERVLQDDTGQQAKALPAEIARIRASIASDGGTRAAEMGRSVDGFEKALGAYSAQQDRKTRLQTDHVALMSELQATAARISAAQESRLKEAGQMLTDGIEDTKAANNAASLTSFAIRGALEMRVVERGADGKTDRKAIGEKSRLLSSLIRRLSTQGETRAAGSAAIDALDDYLDALDIPEDQPDRQDRIAGAFEPIMAGLRSVEQVQSSASSKIQVRLEEQQARVGTATTLLAASAKVIIAAKATQIAEAELFRSRDDAAAAAVTGAADELIRNAQEIYDREADTSAQAVIKNLIGQVRTLKASVPEILEANRAQAEILKQRDLRLAALVADARRTSDEELARMEAERSQALAILAVGVALAAALGLVVALLLGRSIVGPIVRLADAMRALAKGDLAVTVPARDRHDEVGTMAEAVGVFQEALAAKARSDEEAAHVAAAEAERVRRLDGLTRAFEASVSLSTDELARAAEAMQQTSQSMTQAAERTNDQSMEVAGAAEQTSSSVETVAAATEEMAISIREIARQVTHSASIAGSAVEEAKRTDATIEALVGSADRIGEVVALIQGIASQTNLLALNATIEAARAGEAGRGFAVVASEVKELAGQTAKATEEISGQIARIQGATADAVEAIRQIGGVISEMADISTGIAAAMEEQGAATQEIARNVQQAAQGTQVVTGGIRSVRRDAEGTGAAASQVLDAAHRLAGTTDGLTGEIGTFLAAVKVA